MCLLFLQVMVLQVPGTVTILRLAAVQDLLGHQAAQIITLLHPEDILLHHTLLVHQGLEVQVGLHNSQDLWDLLEALQMDPLHHLHQVLMICTTIGLAGLNQDMEVPVLHIQAKTRRVMVLLQELLLVHHPPHLQEALLLPRVPIRAQQPEDHKGKDNPLILVKHHTLINTRYVEKNFASRVFYHLYIKQKILPLPFPF